MAEEDPRPGAEWVLAWRRGASLMISNLTASFGQNCSAVSKAHLFTETAPLSRALKIPIPIPISNVAFMALSRQGD